MKPPTWVGWTLLIVGAVLVGFGLAVLGFLSEPSAVGRVRTLLQVIGYGFIAVGIAGGVSGLWIHLRNRT
ncbi:MAG TPA: hypothetical protein VHQ03_10610 [Candidatus Dormibacteraeota bacterium]|nr:hypothetical protein [Candidatus Dormibacteraeota bacterium]